LRAVLAVALTIATAFYFVVAAALLGLRFVVLPHLDSFRPRIEQTLSSALHAKVTIGQLRGRWSGLQPSFEVSGLEIVDAQGKPALSVPAARATLSWLSLLRFRPILSDLAIDQPELTAIRHADRSYTIAGFHIDTRGPGNDTFLRFVLTQQWIILRGGTLHWRDDAQRLPVLTLSQLNLAIANQGLTHRIGLQAQPDGTTPHGPLDFRMRFRHTPLRPLTNPENWSGTAYALANALDLPVLARYSGARMQADGGVINAVAWLDFQGGAWRSAHGALSGSKLSLRADPTLPHLDVPSAGLHWTLQRNALDTPDVSLEIRDLHAELGGEPPLAGGLKVTRLLRIGQFNGRFRRASVGQGQLTAMSGDAIDLGLLSQFLRALPLPHRIVNELNRFDPRGTLTDYTLEGERKAPRTPGEASAAAIEGDEPLVRYRVKARLDGVSLGAQEPPPGLSRAGHPRIGLPGVENISGAIDADTTHGSATIDTRNAAVTIPGLFDNPRIEVDTLTGSANWTIAPRRDGDTQPRIRLNLTRAAAGNADVQASASGVYTNAGQGRGALDLNADFDRIEAKHLARYLPTGISDRLRVSIGHGLQAGALRNATMEVHGDLEKFPYTRFPDAGKFVVVAPITGARFDPTPYPSKRLPNGLEEVWPAFDGIDGIFQIHQNQLRFDIERARYRQVELKKVRGRIDDLASKASDFVIDGDAGGPLADMLHYANRSTLGALSHGLPAQFATEGNAQLALHIAIPRHEHPHTAVRGTVTLDGNRIGPARTAAAALADLPPVTDVRGKIDFTERTITVNHATGQFLGGPISGDGGMRQDGSVIANVAGRIAADAARPLLPEGPLAALFERVSGSAPYSIQVRAPAHALPQIVATSDLTGLALDLPAPFDKPAGTPMPFSLTFRPPAEARRDHEGDAQAVGKGRTRDNASDESADNDSTRNDADLNSKDGGSVSAPGVQRLDARLGPLNAVYLVTRDSAPDGPDRLTVKRGAIGVNQPAMLPASGVDAALDLNELDADAWRAVIAKLTTTPTTPSGAAGAAASPFAPTRFNVKLSRLTLLQRQWDEVVLNATRTAGQWQATVASTQAAGQAEWRPDNAKGSGGALQAHLTKLVVPDATGTDRSGAVLEQRAQTFPSIDLVVDDLTVHRRDFGKLEVMAKNVEKAGVPIWQVDKLDITNPAAKLSMTANWRAAGRLRTLAAGQPDAPRRTVVNFKLDIADAGALLDRFGLPRTVKDGAGSLSGKVGWHGGPTAIDYPTLTGTVSLELEHGQILKVEPGIAKLLGVLSLQGLARFLTFDFKGTFGEGLPFHSIKNTSTIQNGIARTDDFTIRAAPAVITLKGVADISKETQDLLVTVVPNLSGGTAALAATVVNPLLGLGTLVASLALSDPISQSLARRYQVTGSWAHPHVEHLDGDRGKITEPHESQGSP
jgi:uncharacterized protein YhdP